MTGLVNRRLVHYAQLVSDASSPYLRDDHPQRYLYDLVADYPRRGGKALRSGLCLATCSAFGGSVEEALPSAIAIELMHNAFLIHDDIEDESQLRRGQPTLHQRHGVPLALNAGDALLVLAQQPLQHNRKVLSNRMAARVGDEFVTMAHRTVEGQAIELGWRRDNVMDLTAEDYLDLVLRKTCWYTTIHPLRVGALIGSWGDADLRALIKFGFYLGAAFQITDDRLNLIGDVNRYGKEQLGDLREGKRTLMLVHLIDAIGDGDTRQRLQTFLKSPIEERSEDDVEAVFDMMVEHGSIEFARQLGHAMATVARLHFTEAFRGVPYSRDLQFIYELTNWVLDRDS